MYTAAIAVKSANNLIEADWATAALKVNPSFYGIATVVDNFNDKDEPEGKIMQVVRSMTSKDNPSLDVAALDKMQKDYKEETIVAIFGRSSGTLLEEDLQPYTILENEDSSPALVAFLEGDFSSYAQTDGTYSPEYFAVQKFLMPRIQQIARLVDGDVDKLMTELLTPNFRDDMEKMWGTRGTLTLYSDSDKLISVHNNPLRKSFKWGWASNHFGIGEVAPVAATLPAAVVAKGKNLARSLSASGPVAEVQPPGKVVGQLAPPPVPDTAIPKEEIWYPPASVHGKSLKNLYRNKHKQFYGTNELPDNWETRPGLKVPKGKGGTIKSLADLPRVAGQTTLVETPKSASQQVVVEEQPILSPKMVEAMQEDFLTKFDYTKKVIDVSNNAIEDPTVLPALENKFKPVWDQLGMDLESFFKVQYPELLWACQKYPVFGAQMILNLMALVIQSERPKQGEYPEKTETKPSEPAGVRSVPSVAANKSRKVLTVPTRKTA